ncbi:MAG TPA: phosphotransferase family protein [Acidimicrobiia bacterium]|nr:phosphotransferase family protein [Acidimicrobiia bacterium]
MSDDDALALVDEALLVERIAAVAPLADEITIDVLSGGRSNLTYRVRSGPHDYVVRRRPMGPVAKGAHDMAREHRVLAALQGSGLPIPTVYGFWDDERVVGAPFYVMSYVAGSVFHGPDDVATLSESQARAISEATVDVLDRLHRVDPAAVGLGELGRPDGFVARRIGRWLEQWRAGDYRDHPLVEPIGAELAARVPTDADATLVHGDYRLGNLLVAVGDQPDIAAILDWEMSTLGDPLTDLAHLLVYWDRTRGRLTHESQRIAEHPGFLSASELAERYATRTGRDLTDLDFYLAFEHWRAAIIKEGIYLRTPDDDELGDSVARHLEEAADLLSITFTSEEP